MKMMVFMTYDTRRIKAHNIGKKSGISEGESIGKSKG